MNNTSSSFNWKYFIFITLFIIVCLEIFGRIYLGYILKKSTTPKFRFNSYRIYEHIPNFREGDGKKDWIVINSEGFRRSEKVAKIKPTDTYRIFLMGGSAAHGISSAPPYPVEHIYMNQTIDYYLEKLLQHRFPGQKFEVINAAVTGYQVFQHTAYLLSEILDYHPDMVIFMDGANDHYFNNPDFDYMGGNPYQFWKPRLQQPSLKGLMEFSILWLSKYSSFARGVYAYLLNADARSYDKLPVVSYKSYPSDLETIKGQRITAKKNFLRAIEANINILTNAHIATVICLQPMLVLRDTSLLSAKEKGFLRVDHNTKLLRSTVVDEISELTNNYHLPFIDLNSGFNDTLYLHQQLFLDYCHLTPQGGNVVASSMFRVVETIFANTKKN